MRALITTAIGFVVIAFGLLVASGIFIVFLITNIVSATEDEELNQLTMFPYCNDTQEVDVTLWENMFSDAGLLTNTGNVFLQYAEEYNVDPVLMAAISFHETGSGTSSVLSNYNNPAGLMNPDDNWRTPIYFNSIANGIESLAKNLNRMINEEGKVTIDALGTVYAPLDAENDPNGLNINWVPDVTTFTEMFGGLTKNCDQIGTLRIINGQSWVAPYGYRITSPFSADRWGEGHNGVDLASEHGDIYGTPAVAFADGIVVTSRLDGTSHHSTDISTSSGWGWYVAIDHGDGLLTRYAHLAHKGIPVGSEVRAGEFVGTIGSTGRSTGPHLHFEIVIDGNFVDPMIYLGHFLEGGQEENGE